MRARGVVVVVAVVVCAFGVALMGVVALVVRVVLVRVSVTVDVRLLRKRDLFPGTGLTGIHTGAGSSARVMTHAAVDSRV